MVNDKECIPCQIARKVNYQRQKARHEAKVYMKANNLSRIELVQDVNTEEYTFCQKGDPRLYSIFIHVETLTNI